jgi:hypothetical protein
VLIILCLATTQHDWTALVSSRGYATKKAAAPAKAKPKSKASGPQKSNKPVKNKKIKIVLTSDVPSVGVKGEDVEVAKGFARNYLFPQKLAVYCTEENLKLYEAERAVRHPIRPCCSRCCPLARVSPHAHASQNIDYEKRQKLQELAKAKKRLSKVEVLMKRQIIQVQPEQVLYRRACAGVDVDVLLSWPVRRACSVVERDADRGCVRTLARYSMPP